VGVVGLASDYSFRSYRAIDLNYRASALLTFGIFMIVINDLHLGVSRMAGTTPASAQALKKWQMGELASFLVAVNDDLLIAGDLFDGFDIPNADLLDTYQLLSEWLKKGFKLVSMRGNHDASNDSSKLSSFDLLGALLSSNPNVKFMSEPGWAAEGIYCIPHLLNQDRFDDALSKVPKCVYCVLHCNVDNNFAKEADHSLNISKQQLAALPADTVYVAHEHNSRVYHEAFIGGVQWPTSVSDCLDRKDKYAYTLNADGISSPIITWVKDSYVELDWRNPIKSEAQFIRFVGHAKPVEAADMANTIARYRRESQAFVITNGVKVSESEEMAELALSSLEAIKGFDVMEALKKLLTAEENQIIESLT